MTRAIVLPNVCSVASSVNAAFIFFCPIVFRRSCQNSERRNAHYLRFTKCPTAMVMKICGGTEELHSVQVSGTSLSWETDICQSKRDNIYIYKKILFIYRDVFDLI